MAEQASIDDNIPADRLAEELEQIEQQLVKQRAQYQGLLREARLARAAANDSSWELADVEHVVQDAGASPLVAVDRAWAPHASAWPTNLFGVEQLRDGLR